MQSLVQFSTRSTPTRFRVRRAAWLLLLLPALGCAGSLPESSFTPLDHDPTASPTRLSFPFAVGEELTYGATLGGLPAGAARLQLLPDENANLVRLELEAKTIGAVRLIHPMSESIQVRSAVDDLRPRTFHQDTEVRGRRRITAAFFDDLGRSAVVRQSWNGSTVARLVKGHALWDPASLLYLLRTLSLPAGERRNYELLLGGRTYHLMLTCQGLVEIETPAGRFERVRHLTGKLLRIPDARQPRGQVERRLELWIATVSSRPPLRLRYSSGLGSVLFELESSRSLLP